MAERDGERLGEINQNFLFSVSLKIKKKRNEVRQSEIESFFIK